MLANTEVNRRIACIRTKHRVENRVKKGFGIFFIVPIFCENQVKKPCLLQKSFIATGIAPYNPDIFTDPDFVQAVEQNDIEVAIDADITEDIQRRIVFNDAIDPVGREEEVLTSEPSELSSSVSLMSLASNTSSVLDAVGPLQGKTPKPKSNRGRKPMESAELTFPETMSVLKHTLDLIWKAYQFGIRSGDATLTTRIK
ncbi:uncharacterized protein LOC129564950 [Sitodiplosis mosellana]|uniref:uncharacterized protein LOC129564950 n=1 Tax=Sitodiplosis mosellana TaxID=263140 RepID=UPI0024452548|nr:uncharacterized protein LOC129564950 [Sitodiplosis mosellana]